MPDTHIHARALELLAPARDADTAVCAIDHGADAVYMGASHHGARSAAGNSIDDIARVAAYAHGYGARVYVTVNTIVYDSELDDVAALVRDLWRVGVDALIVQDMSLLEMPLPPIALHASTQCDTRDGAKAAWLASCGMSQVVIARESSLDEIRAIRDALPDSVAIEAFCHGALCVSYSGDCQAGAMMMGRSANRGECPQVCRLPFDLYDGDGRRVVAGKHLLSLRDMCRIADLGAMADAGVSSFKIEGRLKDPAYVANVVAAYRRALDSVIDASGGRFRRASDGTASVPFAPDVTRSFNRGFTSYFLRDTQPRDLASADTPKMVGTPVGTVTSCRGNRLRLKIQDRDVRLANGDGLAWFDSAGHFDGARVNIADGDSVLLARSVDLRPGTRVYRNFDKAFDDTVRSAVTVRRISVTICLRRASDTIIALDVTDETGRTASASMTVEAQTARTPQTVTRRTVLTKTGDTAYLVTDIDDTLDDLFVPSSRLAQLRRDALSALTVAREATYRYDYRRPDAGAPMPGGVTALDYHANVANRLAHHFYRRHGVTGDIAPALEVERPGGAEVRVMETRYCLRRQLGACLREGGEARLRSPLTLRTGSTTYRIDFDCRTCRMRLYTKQP